MDDLLHLLIWISKITASARLVQYIELKIDLPDLLNPVAEYLRRQGRRHLVASPHLAHIAVIVAGP
jgi:hypothetical protein